MNERFEKQPMTERVKLDCFKLTLPDPVNVIKS